MTNAETTTWNPGTFTTRSRQLDRDDINNARTLANAKGTEQLRNTIASLNAVHASHIETISDPDLHAYAAGVMSEYLKRLADLAEKAL